LISEAEWRNGWNRYFDKLKEDAESNKEKLASWCDIKEPHGAKIKRTYIVLNNSVFRILFVCAASKKEVLQSPIRIKVISVANRQVGRHPWQIFLPHKIIGAPVSLISTA